MKRTVACLTLCMSTLLLFGLGCEPAPAPQPVVSVPPPGNVPADAGAKTYDYSHEIRIGGAHAEMAQRMREELIVAVGRVGDTSKVDSPFGDAQMVTPATPMAAVGSAEGDEVRVTIAIDEDIVLKRLAPEPIRGFGEAVRLELMSELQRTRCYTVVERERINDVMRELEFGQSKYAEQTSDTPALKRARYEAWGRMSLNPAGLQADPVTPDNWTGKTGFPEDDTKRDLLVFSLRLVSMDTGVVAATAKGYGDTLEQAVRRAVRGVTSQMVRDYKLAHEQNH